MLLRPERFNAYAQAVIRTLQALTQMAGPGMIQRLDFGGFILLRPEVLSRHAAAVARKGRKHPQELGCIREDELLAGDLDYQDFQRLSREDEAVVLRTLLETFISPVGRKRIAQRFIAGFPGEVGTSPARDERDDRQLAQ